MKEDTAQIRNVTAADKQFWLETDRHLSERGFEQKVRDGQGYVITCGGIPAGILRYGLFWDSIPFCNMLYIDEKFRRRGLGKELLQFWEDRMRQAGCKVVMTSTQSDESAQHFYRKSGYRDAGALLLNTAALNQPTELFFIKEI